MSYTRVYGRQRVKTSVLKNGQFSGNTKTDFKSSYFFLICDHLHNDATLGCKYSVYIENLRIFSKRMNFFDYMRF